MPLIATSQPKIVPATPGDVEVVLAVLNEAAQWVVDRGAEGWRPGQWRKERLLEAIGRGETFLAREADVVVGTISLQWADETFWPAAQRDAGYVIAVAKGRHGKGVGHVMLAWAERMTLEKGRSFLRLDCHAGNSVLRAYYESQGFEPRGEATLVRPTFTYVAARYEKIAREGRSRSQEI